MARTALKPPPSDQSTFTAYDPSSVEYTVHFTYYIINGYRVRGIDMVESKIVASDHAIAIGTLDNDNDRP